MAMEISTTVFESKENDHGNFHDSNGLNPKTGKMVMEISTTVFESKDRQNGHGNFHDSF